MTSYRIVSNFEAVRLGYPGSEGMDPEQNSVYRFEGDEPRELIGQDGGEPEDQVLYRDWRWVRQALADAYALGRERGREDSTERMVTATERIAAALYCAESEKTVAESLRDIHYRLEQMVTRR